MTNYYLPPRGSNRLSRKNSLNRSLLSSLNSSHTIRPLSILITKKKKKKKKYTTKKFISSPIIIIFTIYLLGGATGFPERIALIEAFSAASTAVIPSGPLAFLSAPTDTKKATASSWLCGEGGKGGRGEGRGGGGEKREGGRREGGRRRGGEKRGERGEGGGRRRGGRGEYLEGNGKSMKYKRVWKCKQKQDNRRKEEEKQKNSQKKIKQGTTTTKLSPFE